MTELREVLDYCRRHKIDVGYTSDLKPRDWATGLLGRRVAVFVSRNGARSTVARAIGQAIMAHPSLEPVASWRPTRKRRARRARRTPSR